MQQNYDIIFNNDSSKEVNDIIKNYFILDKNTPISNLPNTNSINIIIGSNNSGKSRFMRYLMSCKNLIGVKNLSHVEDSIKEYNDQVEKFNYQHILKPWQDYNNKTERILIGIDRVKEKLNVAQANQLVKINISDFFGLNEQINQNRKRILNLKTIGISGEYFTNFSEIDETTVKDLRDVKNYYIPTLRSAHSLFERKQDSYTKIEHDIFLETLNRYYNLNTDIEVFTGLHLYKEILNSRNSKRAIRESFEKFEQFIGKSFFNNKQVDIVAEFNKDESLSGKNYSEIISVHIEGEKETRNLHDLGDGIQAIIILMYKIFTAESNSFIFIDEPELNLHPGMQRLFLDQISSNGYLNSKNLKYFISTHSNHLLDLTLAKNEISIYSFSSNSQEKDHNSITIKNVNSGDNSILKNLGVNNSSVFLANCSIWVEGISDRNYIKAFLRSYIQSLNEEISLKQDIDYAFFEYAGSNLEHYIFNESDNSIPEQIMSDINSLALNNRIFLLADSDMTTSASKKGQRLKKLEDLKRSNFCPYIIWKVREIENLLTKDIWQKTLIILCNKDLVKTHENEIQSKITEVIQEIDISLYDKRYIGEFLNVVSQKLGKIGKTNIFNESCFVKLKEDSFGTLVNKRELSETILEKNISWEVFSKNKHIVELTKSIFDFIAEK